MSKNLGSALVIFSKKPPKKSKKWWRQFDTLIAPKQLEEIAHEHDLRFTDLNPLISSGSVEEATELTRRLSLLTDSKNQRISKIINYEGYELWWINYDSLMYKYCLPYTQYRNLLEHLGGFSSVHVHEPQFPGLFHHFLVSHNCQYVIETKRRFIKKLPLGMFLQVILSIPFLLWAKLRHPRLMVWTSDKFDPPRLHDFRMRFIYEELTQKDINHIEFIRSMEKTKVVLQHALKRRRPVIYSYAIVNLMHFLSNIFGNKDRYGVSNLTPSSGANEDQKFWFLVATSYIHNTRGDIWGIHSIKLILKFIGIKGSIIDAAVNRNFHEVLACKLLNIPTVGIQHGASPRNYFISDFMHEFDGEKQLSVDKYGLWSKWWQEYYIKHSKAYRPEQLYVSGHMRPLERENTFSPPFHQSQKKDGVVKVLFVPGQLSDPKEILPYLLPLMEVKNISLHLTFRSYRDDFEEWLKENEPQIIERIGEEKILRGSIHDAISQCDIVVGAQSTAVLEALLQLRPLIFFRTKKWGDYYDLKSFKSPYKFFVENPTELISSIEQNIEASEEILKELQERFFGDPYQNGGKWVVDQFKGVI